MDVGDMAQNIAVVWSGSVLALTTKRVVWDHD